jgi:hypothetical protein
MRILHAAIFNTRKYGADMYATDRKISAGLVRDGHFVYDFSYRDICRNESFFRTSRFGGRKMNRKLLKACSIIRPELVLLGHSELISAPALAEIKRLYPRTKIGLWYVDALFHREKMRHVRERLDYIDVFFATTGGDYLKEYSTPATVSAFIPNMVDPAVESGRAFQATSFDNDFIYCGRDSGDPERQAFLRHLQQETAAFLRSSFRGCLGNGPLTGQGYLEFLAQSRMALNFSRRNDVELYSSDRLAQLTGNGLLTFCPRIPKMGQLFGEDELVYFETVDDLLEKIKYFHEHDDARIRIAENGHRRAHTCYNSQRVCRFMIELLFELPFSSEYEWGDQIYDNRIEKGTP